MRIALLHYTCAPVVGGVERVITEQAVVLAQNGHEITLIVGEGALPQVDLGQACGTLRLHLIPALRDADSGFGDDLRAALMSQEVVILHNVLTMPFHPALAGELWRLAEELAPVRLIGWVHDVAACSPHYLSFFQQAAGTRVADLLRSASPFIEYVAVSESRQLAFQKATGASECRVIPNGFDVEERLTLTPRVRHLAAQWKLFSRSLVLVQPARLIPRKNVEASLHIVAELCRECRRRNLEAPLLVVTGAWDPHQPGSSLYRERLFALREELNLSEHVCFAGETLPLSDKDVDALYRVCDAVLLPSEDEGFGLPLLESALHRLPLFCRAVGPLPSLLPQGTAKLLPADGDPAAAARQIMRQLGGSQAIKNRKTAMHLFGWPSIYQNYLAPLLARTPLPTP